MRLPVEKGQQAFVLVVSLFEDTGVLPFTVTCYSEEPAALYTAVDCPKLEGADSTFVSNSFKYRWDEKSAGGSPNRPDFEINPMFRLQVSESMRVFVKLVVSHEAEKGPKCPSAVGLQLYNSGERSVPLPPIAPPFPALRVAPACFVARETSQAIRAWIFDNTERPWQGPVLRGGIAVWLTPCGDCCRVKFSDKAVPPQAGEEAYTPHIAWREYQLPEVPSIIPLPIICPAHLQQPPRPPLPL
jgi:hypothetical protein